MPVQLIVDCYGIDTEEAHVVGTTEAEIDALRQRAQGHLTLNNPELLRLRLGNLALHKHFCHLEGMKNVLPTRHLLPRVLLAERLKIPLPDWLTDDWIVRLGLLNNINLAKCADNQPFDVQLLIACQPNLIIGNDFYTFITALRDQSAVFIALLGIDSIKARLLAHLTGNLAINAEMAALFIEALAKSPSTDSFLQKLAYQQCAQLLRQTLTHHSLVIALPAQTLPAQLLAALPRLPLTEKYALSLPTILLDSIRQVARKILHKECEPDVLADFVIADWSGLWAELTQLCEDEPQLMTAALATQCRNFESQAAQRFVEKLAQYLACSHYRPLLATASVEEALDWSVGYFAYLRTALLSLQALDETINSSFTDWLVPQSSRISRSDSDWRFCAKQIHQYLANGYLVVITVIDALSALNQDVLLEELNTIEHLTVLSDTLFSPLPTLTEIGKMAVLTGKQTYTLPNNSQAALQQTYQAYLSDAQGLKIIKSWEESNIHITEQTNLVVFFENRLDERLHDAASFSKHRDDIKPIVRQLKRTLQGWLKDAAYRDVVFFITADHGMTVTNGRYNGEPLGETKDRVFKLTNKNALPENFVLINQDSKDAYAVPKTRLGLSDAPLSHGGLTPEEVLIPFIALTRPSAEANKLPVEVAIVGECLRLGDKYWQLECRLNASVQVETVRLILKPPFKLEFREPIDIIRAHKAHVITLKFRAGYEQEGLITVDLELQYKRAEANETNIKSLHVNFPASFIQRDTGTQSFEDMF